jgi:hypothetical protein
VKKSATIEDAERWARRRVRYLVAALVFGMVSLFFAVGAAAWPDHSWDGGDLAVLGGSLGLGVVALLWARVLHRRVVATVAANGGPEIWLPAVEGDTDGRTSKLRALAWRAGGLTLLWCALTAAGVAGFAQEAAAAQRLLDTGARVGGYVVHVEGDRSDRSFDVGFFTGGGYRMATVHPDSSRVYLPGDRVTVIYDAADPTRVRTPEEANADGPLPASAAIVLLPLSAGILFSALALGRWASRYRAVRRTGWHEAVAFVRPSYRGRPVVEIEYSDRSELLARVALTTHGTAKVPEGRVPVRVGGTDLAMVVVFDGAGWRGAARLVPVTALGPRFGGRRALARTSRARRAARSGRARRAGRSKRGR